MIRKIYFLTAFMLIASSTLAQDDAKTKQSDGFQFAEYQEAVIHLKTNLIAREKINFNLTDGSIWFLDKADGSKKIVEDPLTIASIKIGERTFFAVNNKVQELLPCEPPLYVERKIRKSSEGATGAYGIKSQTTATTGVTHIAGSSGEHVELKTGGVEYSDVTNTYWVEKDGKKKKFADFKQFIKLYPKSKTAIEEYVKTNKPDFNNTDDVIGLCKYAEGL